MVENKTVENKTQRYCVYVVSVSVSASEYLSGAHDCACMRCICVRACVSKFFYINPKFGTYDLQRLHGHF